MTAMRPSQPQFVARWWVNDAGYELYDGDLELGNRSVETEIFPTQRLQLATIPIDPTWYLEIDQAAGKIDSRWILATGFDATRPEEDQLGEETPCHVYEPLKVQGLHRTFAECTNIEKMIAFACEYGFLGMRTWQVQPKGMHWHYGETELDWQEEVTRIRVLLELWNELRAGPPATPNEDRTGRLSQLVSCRLDMASLRLEWLADFQHVLPVLENEVVFEIHLARETGLVNYHAARAVLRDQVRIALQNHTSPWFDVVSGGQLSVWPIDLLGAIYVHFLQELLGRSDPLFRCASCGKWFIQRHASRIYCSDACKQKAYRQGMTKKAKHG